MALGGRRPGAGRKPGQKQEKDLRKRYLKDIKKNYKDLIASQIALGKGIYTTITTKSGITRVYKKSPDGKTLQYLFSQAVGSPPQSLDLTSGGEQIKGYVALPPENPKQK